jgi:micrococcal nuclease
MKRIAIAFLLFPLAVGAHQVVGIADGDTMTLLVDRRPLKIRLANIDAPEKKQPFGQRSKESLSNLCWGKDATYQAQTIDKYGRTVAVVTCGGVEANRAQVERGMAWVYAKYNADLSLPKVMAAAKASGKGLWVDKAPVPPWEFRHPAKTPSDSTCYTGPRGGHYRIVSGHKQYGC